MPIRTLLALAVAAFLAIDPGSARAACDRDCLIGFAARYVDAMMKHDASLLPVAENAKFTENGETKKLGEGLWRSVTAAGTFKQYFADPKLGAAGFFGVFQEGGQPVLLALRLKIVKQRITEVETIAARRDERNWMRPEALNSSNPAFDEILPREARSSRKKLVAIAHAYFDGIENHGHANVPADPKCSRRENGVFTLKNEKPESEPCPLRFENFVYIPSIRDRRVGVVDEVRGLVWMWAFFDIPGNIPVPERTRPSGQASGAAAEFTPPIDTRKVPRSLYIAELFQVRDGKIRDIEAFMFNLDLGSKSGWE